MSTDGMTGRSWLWAALFICASSLFLPRLSVAASISRVDDLGRRVELERPAQRIVTLAPFLTELAFSAGVGERVAGVSAFSDYPREARARPQVASSAGISLEALAALHPDLVLAWADTIRREDIARIEAFGAAVFVARARRMDDVARLLQEVGMLAGRDEAAQAARFRERIAALRRTYSSREPVGVFLEVWHQPLTTIGGEHWLRDALEICGARNLFADLPGVAPQVDWELVYRRDPWAIVGTGAPGGEAAFRATWRSRSALAAVRAGRFVYVDADLLQRPTLRLADGVARLCEAIERVRR